jgi:hypothetical protein
MQPSNVLHNLNFLLKCVMRFTVSFWCCTASPLHIGLPNKATIMF